MDIKNTSLTSNGFNIYFGTKILYNNSMSYCKAEEVTIPKSVVFIGFQTFDNSLLKTITISANVKYMYAQFDQCDSLESVTVDSANEYYYSLNNCIIETSTKTLIASCKNIETYLVPEDVIKIGHTAFFNSEIKIISISKNVTSIEFYAFGICKNLITINYSGTKAEWNKITKGQNWDTNAGNYTVYCTDGNITKS
jgi:hypothetical protein